MFTAGKAHCPSEVVALAERIKRIHGDVKVVKEASGWHIYCASPICLERHGAVELSKKHLAINAEKHLMIGKYSRFRGTKFNNELVARCMKTGTNYSITQLLTMPTLERRDIAVYDHAARMTVTDTSASLVMDERGNMIPDVPGTCVPLTTLPESHPARLYLAQRWYHISDLEAQFSANFCTQELPEDSEKNRFYRRFSGGFRDTPQNRIVLYGHVLGVRKIWQARYVEIKSQGYNYILHPYANEMVAVAKKEGDEWLRLPGYDKADFDPAKYKTAFGAKRNETVMGFDAALAWNARQGRSKADSMVAITEGPLDAARIFPFGPAVAVLGKHMSYHQASLLCSHFGRFLLVGQNDSASKNEAMPKWVHALSEFTTNIKHFPLPAEFKDVGEMRPDQLQPLIEPYMK